MLNKIIHIITYFVLISAMVSCNKGTGNRRGEPEAVPVTITKAKIENAVFYNPYPANTVALKEVSLQGQVTGYITGIFFKEGTEVHKGEKLYEIDRRKYQAAYEEAQSNVKIAEDNLEKVELDAKRYTELSKSDAVAMQQYDYAMTDLKNAKQQVDVANSALISAKTDYDFSIINAPFNGTIGFSNVKLGSLVTPSQTMLNTISSNDPMGVDFEINQTELRRFEQIEKNSTSNKIEHSKDTTFRLELPDNSLYPYNGKLSVIDRAVDPQTGSIKVRITVPNPGMILKPGMSCNVLVLNSHAGKQIVIPFKAVSEQLGEYFVYVLNGNTVKEVKVFIGPRVGANVVILKGLKAGETIVVEGIEKLHNGSLVTLNSNKHKKYNH